MWRATALLACLFVLGRGNRHTLQPYNPAVRPVKYAWNIHPQRPQRQPQGWSQHFVRQSRQLVHTPPQTFSHNPAVISLPAQFHDNEPASSYLSYDRTQLMPGMENFKGRGIEHDIKFKGTRYGSTTQQDGRYRHTNQTGYLNSLLGLVTGNNKLNIHEIKKASPVGHINLVPQEEEFQTVTEPTANPFIDHSPKSEPDSYHNVQEASVDIPWQTPKPPLLSTGKSENIIKPTVENKDKENARETRASFQKPLEYLRLNPNQRSQAKKEKPLISDDPNSASVRKLIDLIDTDKNLKFPKIISFNTGNKRYKYVYLSSTPNAAAITSKEITKDEDLTTPIGNFVRGPHSIPTRQDAIVRLNQARSLRRQKQNELDKTSSSKKKENPPPISISLLEKAIIVSKRNRPTNISERLNELLKSKSRIQLSGKYSQITSSFPSLNEEIYELSNDNTEDHALPEVAVTPKDISLLKENSPELIIVTSEAPTLEPYFQDDTNESESYEKEGRKVEFQTPSPKFNFHTPSYTLDTNEWIPSTFLFGKSLATTTEVSAAKDLVHDSVRTINKEASGLDLIKTTTPEGVVAFPPLPDFRDHAEDFVTEASVFGASTSEQPQVPLAIQNLLRVVNDLSVTPDDSTQQYSLGTQNILKKSLAVDEDSLNSQKEYEKGRQLNAASSNESKEKKGRRIRDRLSRYPTKEMVHDPITLAKRRLDAIRRTLPRVDGNKKMVVQAPFFDTESSTEKEPPSMSIGDQIKWYEQISEKEDSREEETPTSFRSLVSLQPSVPSQESTGTIGNNLKFVKISENKVDLKQSTFHPHQDGKLSNLPFQRNSAFNEPPTQDRMESRQDVTKLQRTTPNGKSSSTHKQPNASTERNFLSQGSTRSTSTARRDGLDSAPTKASNFRFGQTIRQSPSDVSEIFTKIARAATARVFAVAKASSV